MVEVLERIAEKSGSAVIPERNNYVGKGYSDGSGSEDKGYSTFAEIYLEKPVEVQAGFSVTVCTWRGVPTIDDW